MAKSGERYYWMKLKEKFFDEPAIDWLEEQENGYLYSSIYLKLCLKTLNSNGVLARPVGDMIVPYEPSKLAIMAKTTEENILNALELFQMSGLVEVLDTGEYYLMGVEKMVGSETEKAQQMREWRKKKKLDHNVDHNVTQENRDKILDIR